MLRQNKKNFDLFGRFVQLLAYASTMTLCLWWSLIPRLDFIHFFCLLFYPYAYASAHVLKWPLSIGCSTIQWTHWVWCALHLFSYDIQSYSKTVSHVMLTKISIFLQASFKVTRRLVPYVICEEYSECWKNIALERLE